MSEKRPLFDAYSLRARYFPAILTLLPLLGLLILFHDGIWESVEKIAVVAVVGTALSYLMANVARQRGRVYETSFLERTGGWQTTALLRHRDGNIDEATKARYHRTLGTMSGIEIPDAQTEAADTDSADAAYRSATNVLIERRRGSEFTIVHSENAAYGFWRNLRGLRSIALSLACAVLLLSVVMQLVADHDFSSWPAFWSGVVTNSSAAQVMAGEILYILLFGLLARESTVLEAACSYAFALFKTLDAPIAQAGSGE